MNSSAMHFALREWQRIMRKPLVWIAVAGIAAILALIGPFGTQGVLNLPSAFTYWGVVAASGYSIGVLVNGYADARFSDDPGPLAIVLRGTVIGLLVCALVIGLNAIAFDPNITPNDLAIFVPTVIVIAIIITVLLHVAQKNTLRTPEEREIPPPILDRLPFDKRGALLAISVEDHYVRIATSKGEDLVLMRLTDAIREVGSTDGAQVHRSHWVAFAAVASAERKGAGAVLTLQDGREIPVSRSKITIVREAGLLPR